MCCTDHDASHVLSLENTLSAKQINGGKLTQQEINKLKELRFYRDEFLVERGKGISEQFISSLKDADISKFDEYISELEKRIKGKGGNGKVKMKLPIDVEGSLSDEAIYEVKDIKNLIDTAKSTKQTRIETEKNKTTYQQDLAAAKSDWEKAKKGYEVLLKDQQATSEQVKKAREDMLSKEKAYKDLGGITGSSLTKQENQAKKAAAKQLKQQELLTEQLFSIRRKNQQDEINLMEDGTEKKLAQIDLDYQKELDAISDDIFARLHETPLINRYAAYQALADNWQGITNDIETIQQEGIGAVRVVEPAYKLVKKGDEEIEVPDGLKGRIIPFELVQQEKFQDELKAIAGLQMRVEEISGELDEIRESFSEEESEAYLDSEKENAFDKKAITAGAKAKKDAVEEETKEKLKKIVKLWEEQKNKNKQIKEAKQALIDKTVEAIENLSDEDISLFLHKKWIDPIIKGIDETLTEVLSAFETKVLTLGKKYAISYKQLNEDLGKSQKELSDLIGELTGDEFTLLGLNELINGEKK